MAFVALGAFAVISWLRHREPARAFIAGAFGLLGIVALATLVDELSGYHLPAIEAIRILAFLGSGVTLLALCGHLLPMPSGWLRAGAALAVAAALVGILAGIPSRLGASLTPFQSSATLLIIGVWTVCIGAPAIRFWRESRHSPAVQGTRLRVLAVGYAGMAAALVVSATAVPARGAAGAAIQVFVALLVPALYLAMAPPGWLARTWRSREDRTMYRGLVDLMAGGDDPHDLAARALTWATTLLGTETGMVTTAKGEIIASIGLDRGQEAAIAEDSAHARQPEVTRSATGGARAVVPFPGRSGGGVLAVVAGRLTPVFGEDELERLSQYAVLLGAALDRVALVNESLRTSARQASLLQGLSDLGEALVITEAGRMVYCNAAYNEMTGYSRDELAALPTLIELCPRDQRAEIVARMRRRLSGGAVPFQYESQLITKDGRVRDVESVVRLLPNEGPGRIMGIVRDITERKQVERSLRESEDALRAVALTDSLTGLPNRRGWDAELARAVGRARRGGGWLCVGVIDLDSFKAYNDDWGHQRGDRLLKEMAAAWREGLREVDYLARYGGDEFVVLLPECDPSTARAVLERMLLKTPDRHTCSVGLAGAAGADASPELLARADSALYQAKRDRRGEVVIASNGSRPADRTAHWADVIPSMLAEHSVHSVYQPILKLEDRSLLGYEALARMEGARASASVDELFAAASKLGFSRDLDWLCRRAAFEGARGIGDGVLLFVNVGAGALLDPVHGVDQMVMLARWVERSPRDFVLELSERDLIRDVATLTGVLEAYRAEGFRFAVDDVGEGFSTLEVLGAANPEFIKLARSLLHANGARMAVVKAILTFAATTGSRVIAEGLESESMIADTNGLGVEFGQGFALGRPAPPQARVRQRPLRALNPAWRDSLGLRQ